MNAKQTIRSLHQDGVVWLAGYHLEAAGEEDPHARAEAIRYIADVLQLIENPTVKDEYTKLIREVYGLKHKDVKAAEDAIKKEQSQLLKRVMNDQVDSDEFELPNEVIKTGGSLETYAMDIKRYTTFIHKNVIYSIYDKAEKSFQKVSNFGVEIINHMDDEKTPMRLVKLVNIEGRNKIFDTPFDSFLTKGSFLKMVEQFGNFQYDGSERQYLKLKAKLMDEMGDGRKISELGWQDDGFWCFNNCIVINDEVLELDKNGMIELDGVCFYVPSGNAIYKNNPTKFLNQKQVVLRHSMKSLDWFMQMGRKVHKERFYHAILFAVASAFRDLVQQQMNFFPILFMYGAASTGKDNLVEVIQSMYGEPQEALVMTGKDNTAKAKIRELAQFTNMPAHFSEYKPEPDTDDMIKKLWDGRGYKRGTIESLYGNETVPVRCPIVITSNYYPAEDAVITRLIAQEFFETSFTQEEVNNYDELKDVIKQGISGYLVEFLKLRKDFEKHFRSTFKEVVAEFKSVPDTITMAPRMIQNVAVLGATYKLAEGLLPFSFSYNEWKTYTIDALKAQERKRNSGSVVQRFWDIFLDLVRDKQDAIKHEHEFKIDGDTISIRFSMIHSRYNKMHFNVYRDAGLGRSMMQDILRKSDAFEDEKATIRFGTDSRSSGMVFSLKKLHIHSDLLDVMSYIDASRHNYGDQSSATDGRAAAAGADKDFDDVPFNAPDIPFPGD
jgi:DNA primase